MDKENPTQTNTNFLDVESGVFRPTIEIDQYSWLYVYYNAETDTYSVTREVEYMGFNTEPFWWENLSEQEAEEIIKEQQLRIVALDSVLRKEEIKK